MGRLPPVVTTADPKRISGSFAAIATLRRTRIELNSPGDSVSPRPKRISARRLSRANDRFSVSKVLRAAKLALHLEFASTRVISTRAGVHCVKDGETAKRKTTTNNPKPLISHPAIILPNLGAALLKHIQLEAADRAWLP
jgi:hypothetical protein